MFNRLIAWWTKGKYSHVEIVLSDGTSYSSSFMDGGVRGKHIQFNGSNWDFINISSLVDEEVVKKNIEVKGNCRWLKGRKWGSVKTVFSYRIEFEMSFH